MDLQGPIYCGNPEFVPAADAPRCVEFIKLIGVKSVKALASLVTVSADRICKETGCQ